MSKKLDLIETDLMILALFSRGYDRECYIHQGGLHLSPDQSRDGADCPRAS